MKFFNIDLHISVIADVKYILEKQGHTVVDWSISGHAWVFGKKRADVKIVNQDTWLGLDKKMCDEFFEYYKDFLATFDAFIVTFNSSFALLYEKTDKPIIVVNPTRYENPFTESPTNWQWLDCYLKNGVDQKKITIVSNNKGDAQYINYFTGIKSEVIPSLCLYTNSFYKGVERNFVLVSRLKPVVLPNKIWRIIRFVEGFSLLMATRLFKSFIKKKRVVVDSKKFHELVVNKEDVLKDGYTWQSLYDYKGIVHIPYQISTMSIFEQYSANVPLFFPSKSFLFELHKKYPDKVLSELSFYQLKQLDTSGLAKDNPNNMTSDEVVRNWIELADYYDESNMPFVQYFDSFEHLEDLLSSVNCEEISKRMENFNRERQEKVFSQWQAIIEQI